MFRLWPRLRQPSSAGDGVIDEQNDDRADDGDEHRVDIESGDALSAGAREDEASHARAHG